MGTAACTGQNIWYISCCWLLSILVTFAQAPQIEFHSPPSDYPVAKATIQTITQTQDGFIWMGATNGLIRFDAYEYTYFTHHPADSLSISNNWVTQIMEDKHGVLWITTDGGGLNRFDPREGIFQAYTSEVNGLPPGITDRILCGAEGAGNTLWLGTYAGGLHRFDKISETSTAYIHDPADEHSLISNKVQAVWEDSLEKVVWVGTPSGLDRLDLRTGDFVHFSLIPDDPNNLAGTNVTSILKDSRKRLWVGTTNGLYVFHPASGTFTEYRSGPIGINSLSGKHIRHLFEDSQHRLWISTSKGIGLWEASGKPLHVFQSTMDHRATLRSDRVQEVFEDREGRIWVSTQGGGYSVVHPFQRKIEQSALPANGVNNRTILNFVEDEQGRIWVASNAGLSCFDPKSLSFEAVHPERVDPSSWAIWDLDRHWDGRLLLLTSAGNWWLSPQTRQFSPVVELPLGPSLPWDHLLIDKQRHIWVYSNAEHQLYRLEPGAENWELMLSDSILVKQPYSLDVTFLEIDSKGQLWLGTEGAGLFKWSPETYRFSRFLHDPARPATLSSNFVRSWCEDREGNIWIGSREGLNLLLSEAEDGMFKHWSRYNTELKADVIYGILEDQYSTLWLVTDHGLFHFNPREDRFECLGIPDGLNSYHFNNGAHLRTRDGRMLIGSDHYLNYFFVDSIRKNPYPPEVVLTDVALFGQSLPLRGSPGDTLGHPSPLDKPVQFLDTLYLKWWQNDIAFSFSALNYTLPEKNYYLYRLEGYQDSWTEAHAGQRRAVYTNLDPGTYTFSVVASNNDGRWNDSPVHVYLKLSKPWWRTGWAYFLFGLAALGAIYLHLNLVLKRRMAQWEARRFKKLDKAKTRLYTNISHEFRTPITIIYGMAEQIKNHPELWFRQGIDLIQKNARQLLNMVNQMLELRKLETDTTPLDLRQGDIVAFVEQLVEPFIWDAESKGIVLHLVAEENEIWMDFDPEKMVRICSNLLSNAIKFTRSGGKIYLLLSCIEQAGTRHLKLSVKDTGIGIPADHLPHIFDRFYQVPSGTSVEHTGGTGIGLALISELVRVLQGTVSVSSEVDQGTTFTIQLPIEQQAPKVEEKEMTHGSEVLPDAMPLMTEGLALTYVSESMNESPMVLLVDDNADVLTYLRACLHKEYIIETADDGDTGIAKAIALIPDIIVSDIMMPGTDGLELCEILKADERTNHIPIILLTARADQASRLAGWETGADSFLTKPFDPKELRLRIQNLLDVREQVRQHYLQSTQERSSEVEENAPCWEQDSFVLKVKQLIEEHLDDFDWKVKDLCKAVHISHSQLHRKLTAVCGLSPNRFIKHIRLLHARELLSDVDVSITSVAFDTGFQDPDYFSKVFKETFGQTPSAFRKMQNSKST